MSATTAQAGDALAGMLGDDLIVAGPEAPQDAPGDVPQDHALELIEPAAGPNADGEDDQGDDGDQDAAQPDRSEDDQAGEDDDQDDADDQDDGEEDDDAEPAAETFTVKVDGEEVQVDRAEVIAGYQRQADYSRKTAALAEERKVVAAERGQYSALLGALNDHVAGLAQLPPGTVITPELQAHLQAQQAAASSELDRLDAEARHVQVQEAQQWLLDARPEWRDGAERNRGLGEIVEIAQAVGFSPEEMQHASDPRVLLLAWEAAQYRRIKAGAADVQSKAVKKGVSRLRPGSANTQSAQQRGAKNARQRLKATGSLDAAAAVLGDFADL